MKNRYIFYLGFAGFLLPICLLFYLWFITDIKTASPLISEITSWHTLAIALSIFFIEEALMLYFMFKGHEQCLACQSATEKQIENLVFLSERDALTNLYNRRYYEKRLSGEIQRAKRYESTLSLVILDLDDFKRYNDAYGHSKGDEALRALSKFIKSQLRETDVACRYGGDEFVLLLLEISKKDAWAVTDRIRNWVENNFAESKMTVSAGICTYPNDAAQLDEIFNFADHALYFSKSLGKNKISLYPFERRHLLRSAADLKMEIVCLSSARTFTTRAENIGEGGIRFYYDLPFQVGSFLNVKIFLSESEMIQSLVRVVRLDEMRRGGFKTAVTFDKLDLMAICKIRSYLQSIH